MTKEKRAIRAKKVSKKLVKEKVIKTQTRKRYKEDVKNMHYEQVMLAKLLLYIIDKATNNRGDAVPSHGRLIEFLTNENELIDSIECKESTIVPNEYDYTVRISDHIAKNYRTHILMFVGLES
jgi:hypothetical protein